jgi:hypothetical protein
VDARHKAGHDGGEVDALRNRDRKGGRQLFRLCAGLARLHCHGRDVETEIRDAIRFHIDGLKEDGLPVPKPTSIADYVEA